MQIHRGSKGVDTRSEVAEFGCPRVLGQACRQLVGQAMGRAKDLGKLDGVVDRARLAREHGQYVLVFFGAEQKLFCCAPQDALRKLLPFNGDIEAAIAEPDGGLTDLEQSFFWQQLRPRRDREVACGRAQMLLCLQAWMPKTRRGLSNPCKLAVLEPI